MGLYYGIAFELVASRAPNTHNKRNHANLLCQNPNPLVRLDIEEWKGSDRVSSLNKACIGFKRAPRRGQSMVVSDGVDLILGPHK